MVLRDDLERWNGGRVGGRLQRERIYVYLRLMHIAVQQKLPQHSKAIIIQLKKGKK